MFYYDAGRKMESVTTRPSSYNILESCLLFSVIAHHQATVALSITIMATRCSTPSLNVVYYSTL